MRKIYKILFVLPLLLNSCLSGYEEINTNPLYPNDEQKNTDGVAAGAYFMEFEKRVIPTRSSEGEGTDLPNRYQVAINLAADNWAGYMSPMNNKFNGGANFTTNYLIEGWVNYAFSTFYTNIVNPWIQILDQTHVKQVENGTVTYQKKALSDQAIFSVAQIIKIMGLHRATDTYGPLPYKGMGQGSLKLPYDSQEDIYKSFFVELQAAVQTLSEYQRQGGANIASLVRFDAVYHGNVQRWIRLANSLMLRLAVRVRYVDEELSRKWAAQAVANPEGVITEVADMAMLKSSAEQPFINSLELLWHAYDDCRMGATIYSYLRGYNDPRAWTLFARHESDKSNSYLKAVRTGIPTSPSADFYKDYSVPNVKNETPVYWFKASEVYFLQAEAALFGLIQGNPQQLYEDGITMSFKENEVTLPANYLRSTARPAGYEDIKMAKYNAESPSAVTVSWSDASSNEQKLEKIITQKYIALFPDGQEAWTEWRRTGYPRQVPVFVNRTDAAHGNVMESDGYKRGVRRMTFPKSEYDGLNRENVIKAQQLLSSGVDDCNARLWWDVNPLLN